MRPRRRDAARAGLDQKVDLDPPVFHLVAGTHTRLRYHARTSTVTQSRGAPAYEILTPCLMFYRHELRRDRAGLVNLCRPQTSCPAADTNESTHILSTARAERLLFFLLTTYLGG